MRNIIVAGGRDFMNRDFVFEKCNEHFYLRTDVLVQGDCATGVDMLAREWAHCKQRVMISCPANWGKHSKAAGPIRNKEMAEGADVLVAIWDGKSRGTRSMIEYALLAGLEVHVYNYKS